jgi:hypothetical protein
MERKKHLSKQNGHEQGHKSKTGSLFLSLLLILAVVVGGILAYLITQTGPVENKFTPAQVSCEVTESFDGITKENVNVKNTSNTDSYLRVRLVSYRVNNEEQRIGGTATVPSFAPGSGWVLYGGYYYYTQPVAPNGSPAVSLIDSIPLIAEYNDADGGKQVIEVLAEAIQSAPAEAVGQSWGVAISPGAVADY